MRDDASWMLPTQPRKGWPDTRVLLPEARIETCKRGHEAPHEFRWLGPMHWEMTCTQCRRERRELEAET